LLIVDSLREAGDHDIFVIAEETGLARRIADRKPDLVLIDLASPSRDVLEELTLASGPMNRPVAMFVDRSDQSLTKVAIEAGVSAYVVDGLRADRINPILDAAIARFHLFQRMRTELAATRAALDERKIIDRAKGVLMRVKGLGEDEAYALLRRTAMDQKRKIADVAQALVTAAELLT
ncbi:MAG: ANTAR domain-containing protein, partial [Paracoccaceae bacterium]|nr:ANTAR domain-containing protein [Paracoccaceae bacterium]